MASGGYIAAVLAVALTAGTSAGAGALRVSPVGLELTEGRAASTLTLRNDDDTPMNVQVRVFRWTQGPDGEQLTPATDVVASPPIAPLAPHSERVVRVVRTGPVAGSEASYRVLVDELPPPPGAPSTAVRLLMRHSIPVFFSPPAGASTAAKVEWSVASSGAGLSLTALNRGGRRLRVANVKLLDAGGRLVSERAGLVGYVLAGAQATWTLPAVKPGMRPTHLTADTDVGSLAASLDSRL